MDKMKICRRHQDPGQDPGCGIDGKQYMERRERPEDGPDPQDPEDTGSEYSQQRRRHGPPHSAERSSGDFISRRDALKEKDALAVYTGIDKARFRGMVKPGDTVCITVKPLRSCPPLYTVHAELRVGERLCSGGDLSFAVTRRDGCSQNC